MKETGSILKKPGTNAGILKWRQHELWMVTAIIAIAFAGRLWHIYYFSSPAQFANPFRETNTPFDLYRNVLLPDIAVGLTVYLAYLWFSLYSIPRLFFPKNIPAGKKKSKKYIWLIAQLLTAVFLLGCILNIAVYYRHQWQFNYPGFSIFFDRNNPRSQMDIYGTFFGVAALLGIYALYVLLREFAIKKLLSSPQCEYNISVCNKITFCLLLLLPLHVLLQSFNIVHEQKFLAAYVLVTAAILAMFITNVYWLFPRIGGTGFFTRKNLAPLLGTSFVYAIPLTVMVKEQAPAAFVYCWAIQLLIITPLAWFYFQFNKSRILQLRIVEKELVKSTAGLQFLRSQINPHFLFNTLNTLYGTALQENADCTAEGIQKLGDMMRFMLHDNNLDFIQMQREIEYLSNYISLQKLRTRSSPDILIADNISGQYCNHRIAPMLLIPLVENAFKHGISLQEKSWIKINLDCSAENILFEVRNSVHLKVINDPEKERSGVGFNNVLERLKLLYPDRFRVAVKKDENEYSVSLSIVP